MPLRIRVLTERDGGLAASVVRRRAYCDTFRVWLSAHLPWPKQLALKSIDPHMHYHSAEAAHRFFAKVAGQTALYMVRLTFQRLDKRIVSILQSHFPNGGPQPLLNAVHLALDLGTRNERAAAELEDFFDRALWKRGHRRGHQIRKFRSTLYIGNRGGRNTVAMYSDKPDRQSGGPCCHIELRLQGNEVLLEQGLRQLRDLLTFDHRSFWKRNLRLREVDRRALGKRLNRQHLASKPSIKHYGAFSFDSDLASAGIWLRNVAYREVRDWNGPINHPNVTTVAAELRRSDLSTRGVLRQIDASPYLPPAQGTQ